MSKKIKCFDFANINKYKVFKSNLSSSINNYTINLSDADIKVLQAVLPNYSQNFIFALKNEISNIKSTLNLVNIFNENNDFKVDPFTKFEPSFKVSFSFLIGMIMTIIFAYQKLHVTTLYHYNYTWNNAIKNGIIPRTKVSTEPDFVAKKGRKIYLLEAKGTTSKKVTSDTIDKALEQLFKKLSQKKSNNLNARRNFQNAKNNAQKFLSHIDSQYAIATAFGDVYNKPSEGNKAYLSIIDPEFKGRVNPYNGVRNLYSCIDENDYNKLTEKDIPNFRGREFNIEGQPVRISLYNRFYEIRKENYFGPAQEREDIHSALNAFQNEVENNYDSIKQELGKPNLLFIDGMMIAY